MRDRTSTSRRRASIRLKTDGVDAIARRYGLHNLVSVASFFGVTHHNYSKVVRGVNGPGADFIATVLSSHPEDKKITFDALFEVVAA